MLLGGFTGIKILTASDDCNNATTTGIYRVDGSCVNSAVNRGHTMFVIAEAGWTQIAFDTDFGVVHIRMKPGSTWSSWKVWINDIHN